MCLAQHYSKSLGKSLKSADRDYSGHFLSSTISSVMTEHAIRIISGGCYATVGEVASDSPTVIKVGRKLTDSWLTYALWVRDNDLHNTHSSFPRIDGLVFGEGFYIAEIERLSALNSFGEGPFEDFRINLGNDRTLSRYLIQNCDPEFPKWAPGYLKKPFAMMRNHIPFQELNEDIHTGNIMVRTSEEKLVITDPYC